MSQAPDSLEWEGRWRLLEGRCVFRVTGPDRVRYLNGQVTNDVSRLTPGEAMAACVCSIKGKVEALVWIHAEADALILDGEIEARDFLQVRLNRYLIADDCEIEDVTGAVCIVHHFDSGLGGLLSRRAGLPGWDLFLPAGAVPPFPRETAVSDAEWNLQEIRSLIPRSGREITGNEFPSELGLDQWAVDFHKGCYLGQEIVSRLRSVGRAKRELSRFCAEEVVAAGERVQDLLGNEGIATREGVATSEKSFLGLALFNRRDQIDGGAENERVVTKINNSATSQ